MFLLHKVVSKLEETQLELARTSMQFPKAEPFDHGVQVGKYQGLQLALELIDNILRDDNKKEQDS